MMLQKSLFAAQKDWARVTQYLIGKLSAMVKMIQEDKVVAALSTSIRMS